MIWYIEFHFANDVVKGDQRNHNKNAAFFPIVTGTGHGHAV
jgi:hypothetical protein